MTVATDDRQVLVVGAEPTPASFVIPGTGQIRPKSIYAKYDGTAATGIFVPALKITSDGGKLIGVYPLCSSMQAGTVSTITWFPGAECQ